MSTVEMSGPVPMSDEVAAHVQQQEQASLVLIVDTIRSAAHGVAKFLRGPYADGVPAMMSNHGPNRSRFVHELYPVFDDPRG